MRSLNAVKTKVEPCGVLRKLSQVLRLDQATTEQYLVREEECNRGWIIITGQLRKPGTFKIIRSAGVTADNCSYPKFFVEFAPIPFSGLPPLSRFEWETGFLMASKFL